VTPLVLDIESKKNSVFFDAHGQALRDRAELRAKAARSPQSASGIRRVCENLFEKAALNPLTLRVVAIGIGELDNDNEPVVLSGDDEPALLREWCVWLVDVFGTDVAWCGFNVRQWDLPVLAFRLAMHGIPWPGAYPQRNDYRRIIDVRDIWQTEDGGGNLDLHLRAFGLPLKTADGSQVERMTLEEVRDYNRNDVIAERLLVRRLAHLFPSLRQSAEVGQ